MSILQNPDIRGSDIVFVSGGRLFLHNTGRGSTQLLVSIPNALVTSARFSPDGHHVYMRVTEGRSGECADIYRLSLSDGTLRRLTFLSGLSVSRRPFTDVAGFTASGDVVIATETISPFSGTQYLYRLSEHGSLEPMNLGPGHRYFEVGSEVIIGRDTFELPHWKGYRGGTRGKVWKGSEKGGFRKIIDLETHISSPTVMGNRIYFITDLDGSGQIYSTDLDGKDLRRHTDFRDFYPRNLNSDGMSLVFSMGGDIYTMGEDGRPRKVEISGIPGQPEKAVFKARDYLEAYSATSGDILAVVSRGQAMVIDARGRLLRTIKPEGRVRQAAVADGGRVVTVEGTIEGDSIVSYSLVDMKREVLFSSDSNIFEMGVSRDGRYVAIALDDFTLRLIDTGSRNVVTVDRSSVAMITDFSFSDGGDLLAYSLPTKQTSTASYEQASLRVFDIGSSRSYQLTTENGLDYSPSFSQNGNYIVYLSNRSLDPSRDRLILNFGYSLISRPFFAPLRESVRNPSRKFPSGIMPEAGEVAIERALMRSEPMAVQPADYRGVIAVEDGLILLSVPVQGSLSSYYSDGGEKGVIQKFSYSDGSVKDLARDVLDFSISVDRKRLVYRKEGNRLFYLDLDRPEKENEIPLDQIEIYTSLREEFMQMYDEAWKLARDNFWDRGRAIEIAERIYEKYRALAGRCETRSDLSYVITEMQGEFRTSHSYEMGGSFTGGEAKRPGKLACDFVFDGEAYRISKIYVGDPSNENEKSPLLLSSLDPEVGDAVIEIDGVRPGREVSIYEALMGRAGQRVLVTLRKPDGTVKRDFVEVLADDKYIRYRDWVESRRSYVHERTGGRVGYIHIPDMGVRGYNEFFRQYVVEASRDALVIDVRYNGGGFVSQLLLERLALRRLGYDRPRRGTLMPYPTNSVAGPMVAICNEYAGSDGDIFSYSFRALGLGRLVGTRTWGGVVGISPRRKLIDGTVLSQPEYAFWFTDAGFSVENHGVDPDEVVEYPPEDYLAARDPQLDRAIEIALQELGRMEVRLPPQQS